MPLIGRDKTLFRLFGLPIKANLSWLFLVALVMFSLANWYFPQRLGKLDMEAGWQLRWGLAAIGTVGLFASLIAHELCHSLVARATGMPVSGITLFIFGGVSQLEDEPPTAGTEFFMAVVGPLSSVLIGIAFLGLWLVARYAEWHGAVRALLGLLCYMNFMLAGFNSMPAFPLDGGRVLRSILWGVTDDLQTATRVAVAIGSFFGFGLIMLGVFLLLNNVVITGVWLAIIGFFLRQAAAGSLQMVTIRQQLQGERVARFMTTDLVTVPREMPVDEFVEDCVFHHRFTYYPVVDEDGRMAGLMSARAPGDVERGRWPETTVGELMREMDEVLTIGPEADAVDVLAELRQREEPRAVIVEDGRPVGIVSLRDLLQFLALKIDLEPRRRRI